MVRLTEVEDEHFSEKPPAANDSSILLQDDDEDYTDTDSEISDDDSSPIALPSESLTDRLLALRDIIPPQTRARFSALSSSLYRSTGTGLHYGGKGLWAIATTVLLFGMPYALAFGAEQELMEEERQRGMMAEGASGMLAAGQGQGEGQGVVGEGGKAAL